MNIKTGWLKQPTPAAGLDHLGSQAPCINLYGRLLPGITNVTDRARYYSFYPWFFWAYEKNFRSINWDDVVYRYRKADCLFTLIAARHANQTDQDDDNHGIAMIGRNTLVNALDQLEKTAKPLLLSTYATRESGTANRYFKNKLGGLGQYYIGTFKELGLLDGNSRVGIKYTTPRAEELAESFDSDVDRKLFFESIENDEITTSTLDALASFCPCHLSKTTNEKTALIDLFFDTKKIFGDEGNRRRLSLCILLDLIDQLDKIGPKNNNILDHFQFRNSVYSGYLDNTIKWALPDHLGSIRADWAIYQRNELLSIALQAIFWVALRIIALSDKIYHSSDEFVFDLIRSPVIKDALGGQKDIIVSKKIYAIKHQLPELSLFGSSSHECQIAVNLSNECSNKSTNPSYGSILKQALELIFTLATRPREESKPYGPFEFPNNYFQYYPINLHSFQSHLSSVWSNLSLQELLVWLIQKWGIETHFIVALRKMRRDKIDTFRIRPTDEGLRVVDIPEPIFTSPRFKQALRMLRDLGAVEPGSRKGSYSVTSLGRGILDENIRSK